VATGPSGSREAIAPIASSAGLLVVAPARLISETRSRYDVSPGARLATQVSTFTEARSSACPDRVVRGVNASAEVQRPSTSQEDRPPSAARPRTATSIQLSPGVVADHEATSWVSPKPGAVHGETHRPTSYRRPDRDRWAVGACSTSRRCDTARPLTWPRRSSAPLSHWV
jgi:hypothetical protein